jgi:hypothetical protein
VSPIASRRTFGQELANATEWYFPPSSIDVDAVNALTQRAERT